MAYYFVAFLALEKHPFSPNLVSEQSQTARIAARSPGWVGYTKYPEKHTLACCQTLEHHGRSKGLLCQGSLSRSLVRGVNPIFTLQCLLVALRRHCASCHTYLSAC